MTTEAQVAQALREARDAAVTEAREHAACAVQAVDDADAPPLNYGGLLVQIRTSAEAKWWQKVFASLGPLTDRAQINRALLRSAEAQQMVDEREAVPQPSGEDVGDLFIHAVRQVEVKAYRRFIDAVERAVAPILTEV
ncbi:MULTISPECIES: hypothetical protein [Streptomyces]|uniref:SAV-6107-like HEPN domain-containing protein n=1 Tax=Streptomyces hokutonensis TaxID=1306990 RepID=A0ABW6LTB6_9ACTN|nr:hypothetical protein [Streptomyces prunicolor]